MKHLFRGLALGILVVMTGCMISTFSYNVGKNVAKQETSHVSTVHP